jgi:hypothetical protein
LNIYQLMNFFSNFSFSYIDDDDARLGWCGGSDLDCTRRLTSVVILHYPNG